LARERRETFNIELAVEALYRPYCKRWLYESTLFIDESGSARQLFPRKNSNRAICIMFGDRQEFAAIATARLPNLNLFSADAIQYLSERRFENGSGIDNITDWALEQFQAHYRAGNGTRPQITKHAIFHYVYGVLHDPVYREQYAPNLKREFPRIPFYADFWRWAHWGERLMALHIGYEKVEPWPLGRVDVPDQRSRKAGLSPKTLLRVDKAVGNIMLDTETQLGGIPKTTWDYRLGNRSALEWILDQHKEKTPKDPTIRERFNMYRFVDHKEKVIDLLVRVTRVSVETMAIVTAMKAATASR
jgi:predicted helicase